LPKSIDTVTIINTVANNISNHIAIEKKKVCEYTQVVLEGLVSTQAIMNNLPDGYKKAKKIPCPKCGKRIASRTAAMQRHMDRSH
jgi:predicted RNA-binding Zn-ribbon protein involved in translation (DUF1610 family)